MQLLPAAADFNIYYHRLADLLLQPGNARFIVDILQLCTILKLLMHQVLIQPLVTVEHTVLDNARVVLLSKRLCLRL